MMQDPVTNSIPITQSIPYLHWSLPDEENKILLYPQLNIPMREMTLITGEGDLTALAFDIARYSVNMNPEEVLYLHADNVPTASSFPAFLEKQTLTAPRSFPIQFSTFLQYWPPTSSDIQLLHKFWWLIISSKRFIWKRWQYAKSKAESCLEAGLNIWAAEGRKFSILILEGQVNFEEKSDFYAVMRRLKKKGMTVLVVTPQLPRGIPHSSIWDTVITMKKWRAHHCGNHRLVASIQTRTDKRICQVRYQEKEKLWLFTPDKRDFLREPVRAMMAARLNAKQIVAAINARYQGLDKPLTESALAAMKRFWGFRTYRLEKKPRTRRHSQCECQETFPLLSSDETM